MYITLHFNFRISKVTVSLNEGKIQDLRMLISSLLSISESQNIKWFI